MAVDTQAPGMSGNWRRGRCGRRHCAADDTQAHGIVDLLCLDPVTI